MAEERTVVETVGRRRLVREYAADGKLLRLRLEPLPPPTPPAPAPRVAVPEPIPPAIAEAPPPPPAAPEPTPLAAALDKADEEMAAPPRFEILSTRPVVERAPPAPEPTPIVAPPVVLTPPEELPVVLEAYVEPATQPRQPTRVVAPRARRALPVAWPRSLAVPDLERRVDDLLARKPRAKPKPAARARLAQPQFAPLAREAWEDRLDAVLSRAGARRSP